MGSIISPYGTFISYKRGKITDDQNKYLSFLNDNAIVMLFDNIELFT